MRWIMALLFTALLIVVVLWPTRQPASLKLDAGAGGEAVQESLDEHCYNPDLDDRREVIRNSMTQVEKLVGRYHQRRRIQYESMQLRARISALERALEVGNSRAAVLDALLESIGSATKVHKISASDSHWNVGGIAPSDAVLDSAIRSVKGRVDMSLPSVRFIAKKEGEGRFHLEFLSPQPKPRGQGNELPELSSLPQLPERSDVESDCWNPLESEELTWRLAEARVAGMLGDRTLIQDNQEKQSLEERLQVLKRKLMRDPTAADADNRGQALAERLEEGDVPAVVKPTGTRRFYGVTTQAYRVISQGSLTNAVSAINMISEAGAIIGRIEVCRLGLPKANLIDAEPDEYDADCVWSDTLKRAGAFAYRFDAHVLTRRAQVGP